MDCDTLSYICINFLLFKEFIALSITCKDFNNIIKSTGILNTSWKLMKINYDISIILHAYDELDDTIETFYKFPENVLNDIDLLSSLKQEQEDVIRTLPVLFEECMLKDIYDNIQKTEKIFNGIVPLILTYSDISPTLYTCGESDSIKNLAIKTNWANETNIAKKYFNKISRNRPYVIVGTSILFFLYFLGMYYIYLQYPTFIVQDIMKQKFVNSSDSCHKKWPPMAISYWNSSPTGYSRYTGNGYRFTHGNILQWINYIYKELNCSLNFITNKINDGWSSTYTINYECIPTEGEDNNTLCCINTWRGSSYHRCIGSSENGNTVCFQAIIGNATKCNMDAITTWKAHMGLYSGLMIPLIFIFVWLMLISLFYCN